MDASIRTVLHDSNGLFGISVSLAPQGVKSDRVPLARSHMRVANWLVRRDEEKWETQGGTQDTRESQDEL